MDEDDDEENDLDRELAADFEADEGGKEGGERKGGEREKGGGSGMEDKFLEGGDGEEIGTDVGVRRQDEIGE